MNRITKIAALTTALCLAATMTVGCRNEKQISNDLAVAIGGSELLLALESGEIMLYESVKLDTDVEGHAVNSVTESYVKYAMNGDALEYDLGATVTRVVGGAITSYDARFENGTFTQTLNHKPVSTDEMPEPDLFERFRIDFTAADVENIDTAQVQGATLYIVTMGADYVDGFDTETDGVKYDCTEMVYNYYVDGAGVLRQVLSEQTATLTTTDGNSQQVVKFSQAISE